MRSFWFDPYLWVHLAGIAAVPLFLDLCLLGLAISEPLFPAWLELLFVGAIGILPILWMQWQRPFSIFSLVLLALKPSQLTEDQRRILQRFKLPIHRVLAVLSAVAMAGILWKLYQVAPAVAPVLFPGIGRGAALLIAAIAFLGSNLFFQIPVSVLSVLLTQERAFATTPPYPVERIAKEFTVPGIRVARILPPLVQPQRRPARSPAVDSIAPPPSPVPQAKDEFGEAGFDEAGFDEVDEAKVGEVEATVAEVAEAIEEAIDKAIEEKPEEIGIGETDTLDSIESQIPENQAPEAEPIETVADEAVEFITESRSQTVEPMQLDESSEVSEEIIIPPAPATPPEALATDLDESSQSIEREDEVNPFQEALPDPSELTEPSAESVMESVSSPPVEIVEDATVTETFASELLDTKEIDAEKIDAGANHTEKTDRGEDVNEATSQ